MVRHLLWVGLFACAGWVGVPAFGPRIIHSVSQSVGHPVTVEGLAWSPWGLTAREVQSALGSAASIEFSIGWDQGLSLQVRADRLMVHHHSEQPARSMPRLPSWLKAEILVLRSRLGLEGSDLLWDWEGTLRHGEAKDHLWLSFRAGTSHVLADLVRNAQGDWTGQVDAEKVPLALVSTGAHSLRHSLLGELQVCRGTASGHVEVDEGLYYGDILLENVGARENTLGLEVGIDEGLLSLSGPDGIHLNVSENGTISWGKTGLDGLVGSILWRDYLEIDLSGSVKGIANKQVRVSTSQRAEGFTTRVELLRVPVRSAIAEISFLGTHHNQSCIRVQHFGPEENEWLSHLFEPLVPEAENLSWTAQDLKATAIVDWEEGRPNRLALREIQITDLECAHPRFGRAAMGLIQGSLDLQPVEGLLRGECKAEGLSWDQEGCRVFEKGSLSSCFDPEHGVQAELRADVAGDPWTLSFQEGSELSICAQGTLERLQACFPSLLSTSLAGPELWSARLVWNSSGLDVQGQVQVGEGPSAWHGKLSRPLPNLSELANPLACCKGTWKLELADLALQWKGSDLGAALVVDAEASWCKDQFDLQVWPQKGTIWCGPLHRELKPAAQPLLSASCHLALPSSEDWVAKSLLSPTAWEVDMQTHLQFLDRDDTLHGSLNWSQGVGRMKWHHTGLPQLVLQAAWDLGSETFHGQLNLAQHPTWEFQGQLRNPQAGCFSISIPSAGANAEASPHLDLSVENWSLVRWGLQGSLHPELILGFLNPTQSTSSSEGDKAENSPLLPSWIRLLPERVAFHILGTAESGTSLSVCSGSSDAVPWTFQAKGQGNGWEIQNGQWGPLQFAGRLTASDKRLAFERAELAALSGQRVLAAAFPTNEDLSLAAEKIALQLSHEGLATLLDDLSSWAGSSRKWSKWLKLKEDLAAALLHDSQRGWVLQLPRFEGKIRAIPLCCEGVEAWMEQEHLIVTGTFCNRGRRDPFRAELSKSREGSGELVLDLAGERCRCGWLLDGDSGFCPLVVDGGILGQVGRLTYEPGERGGLVGSVSLDLKGLVPIVPDDAAEAIDKLSLGKGVVFQGRIDLKDDLSVEGRLVGNDVEAFGAVWEKLAADFYCSSQALCLQDLRVEDPAGEIRVPRLELRELEPRLWQLDLPLAGARRLVMHKLRWPGSQKRAVKNLIIEEILLEHILGPADRPEMWSGKGLISFENEAPRPALLFLPAELLGNLGLDLALLEPVRGRIHFAFEDGVIRLKDLEDVVSIKNRSRFFLHPDPGFAVIGWDGTANIRIWMKQFVVLKITQPLNLYITGNLRDPEISFQHSDKRCALSTSSETASTCSSQLPAASAENL